MGVRRLTDRERKMTRAMAGVQVEMNEHPEDVQASLTGWLIGRGWNVADAKLRAKQIVNAVVQARGTL